MKAFPIKLLKASRSICSLEYSKQIVKISPAKGHQKRQSIQEYIFSKKADK